MMLAMREAEKARAAGEVPCGCVIVKDNRVIARGWNQVEALKDATAHAEMQCITSAASMLGGKYLKNCTLYVTVEPCIMCAGALAWSQISRVVYGADDPKRGYTTVQGRILHPKTEVVRGVLRQECEELMLGFFLKLR